MAKEKKVAGVEGQEEEIVRSLVKVKLPTGKIIEFSSTAHEDPARAAAAYAHSCGGVVLE